ncbi:class I SAM-dependent methyltransferase [Pseudooceanicola sp. LIPI14-2-Ac024]|uniref:class I SAM-dependent methyltransferase n=1 Tax=Pseudooceanicola sp. LIPI14-2-Ac024 TaxID=3344875 RepID=UPI0035D0B973
MSAPRLELALTEGGLRLPEAGRIAVLAPRAGQDLSALPRDRVNIVTTFAPDHDAFAAEGFDCAVTAEGDFAAALVFLPRAKKLAQALVAQAAAVTDGPVVIDGTKTDGVDSILKAVRKRVPVQGPMNKAHGKLFWFEGGDFADWAVTGPQTLPGGWVTAPGVFSADGIDPASALLAESLPEKLSGRGADLGAGWGYLSAQVLAREGVTHLDLVEADHDALACARANVTDPRAQFHWADATRWKPRAACDWVISNPPFHQSRAADPGIGQGFIRAAAEMLRPGGRVWIVANRHLPYEDVIRAAFGTVEEAGGDNRFKILTATLTARHLRRDRVT